MRDDLAPALWRKSTFSNNTGECLEVAGLDGCWAVRDSQDPAGPVLAVTAAAWSAFTTDVRAGEFD